MPSPLLDEYSRTGVMTPPLQRAMDIARNKLAMVVPPAPAATPALTPPAPAGPTIAPPAANNTPALVRNPQPNPRQQELERLTTGETGRSGIEQIKNPWLRTPLRVLDAIGSAFVPTLMAGLPGTQFHHQYLVNQATRQANSESQRNLEAAQAEELPARADYYGAQADKLRNPKPDPEQYQPVTTDQGIVSFGRNSGEAAPLMVNGKPAQAPDKQTQRDINDLYADAVADAIGRGVNPNEDPKVQQLAQSFLNLHPQEQKTTPADERARNIYAKPKEQWTPEETAWIKGYETVIDKNKTEPGVTRMQVLTAGRPLQIVDPDNPENVIYAPAGQAMKTGASSPQSIPFQTAKAVQRAYTSGTPASQLVAIATARYHMETFKDLAKALGNNDMKALNAIQQAWSEQFGGTAPTNFQLAKEAFSAEVARAFSTTNVTQEERNNVADAITRTQTPQQLLEAAEVADELLAGKQRAQQESYELARKGQPNFGQRQGGRGTVPTISTKEEYDALPPGAAYIDKQDGKQYTKKRQ